MIFSIIFSPLMLSSNLVYCLFYGRGYAAKKGEKAFRKWFGRINEIRSLVGKVPLVALTATATKSTRLQIMESLEMKNPALFIDSPNRHNISYAVKVATPDPASTFQCMVKHLKEQKQNYERTIIYCQTIKATYFLYGFFESELGNDMYLDGTQDPRKRTVEMFHSRIDELNREHILQSMAAPDGSVRVLVATIAYGMGIDCKDVKVVLHYGPSYNLESYLQESGRAGRTSTDMCKSVMLYSSLMMKYCSEDIKLYAQESNTCRRKMLLVNFDVDLSKLPTVEHLHMCCDICQKHCKCQGDCCNFVFFETSTSQVREPSEEHSLSRKANDGQRESIHQKLNYLKMALNKQYLHMAKNTNNPVFTPAKLYCPLGETQIEQSMKNCEKIFTVSDIFKFVDIWHLSVAKEILFAFNQVFCDVDIPEFTEDPDEEETLDCFDGDFFEFDIEDSVLAGIPGEMFSIAEDSFLPGEDSSSDVE